MDRIPSLIAIALVVAAVTAVLPAEARAEAEGPSAPERATLIPPSAAMSHADILRNAEMQKAGMALLGGGLALIVGGVVLVEIDPYGRVGMAGFVTAGTGIAVWIAGMFLMGFSRPVHGEVVEEPPLLLTAGVYEDGDGFVIRGGGRF